MRAETEERAELTKEEPEASNRLLAVTALVTFVAALGVSGGTNVWMMMTDHHLIKKHRPTLTFRSAIIGDGILLPIISVLMMKSLVKWKPSGASIAAMASVVGGSSIALAFHVAQGRGGLVNWTMTRPWRWNWLGYYHFIYMSTQFAYMLLYAWLFAEHVGENEVSASQKRDLAIIAGCLVLFGGLLATDYY